MGVNSIMNDAGRIGFVIKGDYSNTETYDFLDIAYFNGATYVAKKLTVGNTPDNTEFWHILVDGNIDVNDIAPTFLQAETRENINSGEKLPVIFGKIKKFFADLKTVAFTGSYNDLSNKPSASDIGAVATSKVLDTAELISANTASGNVAGALGVKAIVNNLSDNIDDALDDKLDKYIQLTNTSVNDVWETGIYKSGSWLDSPFASTDNQGTLIVIYYAGNASSNWNLQIFISPHSNEFMVRNWAGSGVYSEWQQIAYTKDISRRLNWLQLASFDSDTTLTVSNMSERSEISIAYGLLYDISATLTLPISVFRSGNGVVRVGDVSVYYVSDTSIKITGLPTNYRLRIFSR